MVEKLRSRICDVYKSWTTRTRSVSKPAPFGEKRVARSVAYLGGKWCKTNYIQLINP